MKSTKVDLDTGWMSGRIEQWMDSRRADNGSNRLPHPSKLPRFVLTADKKVHQGFALVQIMTARKVSSNAQECGFVNLSYHYSQIRIGCESIEQLFHSLP